MSNFQYVKRCGMMSVVSRTVMKKQGVGFMLQVKVIMDQLTSFILCFCTSFGMPRVPRGPRGYFRSEPCTGGESMSAPRVSCFLAHTTQRRAQGWTGGKPLITPFVTTFCASFPLKFGWSKVGKCSPGLIFRDLLHFLYTWYFAQIYSWNNVCNTGYLYILKYNMVYNKKLYVFHRL